MVISSKITSIQRIVMVQNFDIHKELNCYSDMVEDQRRILYAEQRVRLFYIDGFWADHLTYVSYLREGTHLESLASRNPMTNFMRKSPKPTSKFLLK
ncbi:hypothetical protein AMQ83_12430 [Paenibacillus riograndensis]|nr:hypothetical protein AMQ83_12430 [Paenibacillus riograndensis]